MTTEYPRISVVTPTLGRPLEVAVLLQNLAEQDVLPAEVIIIDGAEPGVTDTEHVVRDAVSVGLPFAVHYERSKRGTARQRNVGIERAVGDLIAFVDDDVRLQESFFQAILDVFESDSAQKVGGVAGYRINCYLGARGSLPLRWRMYRRLRLLHTFEPSAYDFQVGYPVNANLQPPFTGTRPVDFMTTACAVWRRAVFDAGLRFDLFFRDYGVLEDAHLSLRAGRRWQLLQCGGAHCRELSSAGGRTSTRRVAQKTVVNYWFVFNSIAGPLSWGQRVRFWRFQCFEMLRVTVALTRHPERSAVDEVVGRISGVWAVLRGEVRNSLRDATRIIEVDP